jgi:predicted Fe-Mo cluster-binding NifX family protein
MRIAVASDDGVRIAQHTGRCQGFVIFEVGGNMARRVEHRTNTFTAHVQGACDGHHAGSPGTAHHTHTPLVEALADCRVLVTRGLGPRLVADLAARGIEAYVCTAELVDDAAALYARGELPKASGVGCCTRR